MNARLKELINNADDGLSDALTIKPDTFKKMLQEMEKMCHSSQTILCEPVAGGPGFKIRIRDGVVTNGADGADGADADNPNWTLEVEETAGTPSVTVTGAYPTQTVKFYLRRGPTGDTGPAPTLAVGTVTDVPYGDPPTVTFTPIAGGYQVDFEIPAGQPGADGVDGADGDATAYTPANDADWTDPNPTTIAQALDRIAAQIGPVA